MTTSHRPTWAPVRGENLVGEGKYYVPSLSYSARDQPSHLDLKTRSDLIIKSKSTLRQQLASRQLDTGQVRSIDAVFQELEPGLKKKIVIQEDWVVAEEDPDDEQFCREAVQEESDEEEEIMRQFQKMKKAKEEEKRRRQMEAVASQLQGQRDQQAFRLGKRWFEDTVFQKQAVVRKEGVSYVNDNIRSQFNRKFIQKFIMR